MSPPPIPSFGAALVAVMRLGGRRILRGRKLRVALVATLLIVIFPGIIAILDRDADSTRVVTEGLSWGFFRMLVPLLPVLLVSGAMSEEIEGRTLHFLTTRPSGRVALAVGKLLTPTLATLGVLTLGIVVLHLAGYATSPTEMIDRIPDTARALGGALLLGATYSGLCFFWGALVPRAAGLLSVIYLGMVELGLSFLPGAIRLLSMQHFAREVAGLPRGGLMAEWVPDVPMAVSISVPAAVFVALALMGVLAVSVRELRFGEA